MKKFSPPEMKEVSFPTPHTPHPTPYTLFQVSSRSFQALLPSFLYQFYTIKKDNARFLKVLILFSQHEHRILTGQKPYFKRVLPLFSNHARISSTRSRVEDSQ